MKPELIRKLHELGIYRDPQTKVKLESMKVADILAVMNWAQEEIEKDNLGTFREEFYKKTGGTYK